MSDERGVNRQQFSSSVPGTFITHRMSDERGVNRQQFSSSVPGTFKNTRAPESAGVESRSVRGQSRGWLICAWAAARRAMGTR